MQNNSRAFEAMMALLRAGLWQQPVVQCAGNDSNDSAKLFPLSPDEWDSIYSIACEQAVAGVVWQGVAQLPQECMPSQSLVVRWVAHVDAIERRNARMDDILGSLMIIYRARGIDPILLKGQTAAALYPDPHMRQSGDFDFYFPNPKWREIADSIAREAGCELSISADGSTVFSWGGVTIEHHSELFDLQRPKSVKIVRPIVKGIEKLCLSLSINKDFTVRALAPYPNLLLLNTHILKHSLGRGVGLRQFCDIALAYSASCKDVDGALMKSLYHSLGLGRWCSLLHSFLVQWMGLPQEALPWNDGLVDATPLMRIVQRGGNFGQHAGQGNEKGALARKGDTALSFLRNIGFCIRYAPGEAFYTFWQLLKGQCKRQ